MKKAFLVALAIVLVSGLILSGCAKPAPAPAPAPGPPPGPPPAPEKVFKWRLQSYLPAGHTAYVRLLDLPEQIKEATNGQLEITVFPAGSLVPAPETLKSVAEGIVEMGDTTVGYHVGIMPVAAVGDNLAMSYRDDQELLTLFFDEGLGDLFREEWAKNGVHLLTVFACEPVVLLSKEPMRNQADFEGKKIRGWGAWNKLMELLGASPVNMSLTEVYTALAMGTIDGVVTGFVPHYELKHWEVCKFGMWPPLIGAGLNDIYVNPDAWNELPDGLKSTVTAVSHDWAYSATGLYADYWHGLKDELSAEGVQWVDIEDKDWLMENAMQLWADIESKDEVAAKGVKLVRDYLKAEGAIK